MKWNIMTEADGGDEMIWVMAMLVIWSKALPLSEILRFRQWNEQSYDLTGFYMWWPEYVAAM